MGSSCSCHVGSTNGGKCKHVIAMLLVFMKQQVTKAGTRALPVMPAARTRDDEVTTYSFKTDIYLYVLRTERNQNTY